MPRVKLIPVRRRNRVRNVVGRRVGYMGKYLLRRGPRRYGIGRSSSVEYASCKDSFTTTVQAGVMNYFRDFQLSDLLLTRAQAIAKEYQFFKITKIEMVVQTQYDTYIPSAPQVMPQIYWMIDKGRNLPAGLSFPDLQQLGAKGRTMNEANRRYAFAPAVGTVDENAGAATNAAAQYKISPWLDTVGGSIVGLSEVSHNGCVFGITKMTPADTTQYTIQVTYHFKFKKPQLLEDAQARQQNPVAVWEAGKWNSNKDTLTEVTL